MADSTTEIATLLYNYLSSFGVPAWQTKAPDDEPLPFIIYDLQENDFAYQNIFTFSVYGEVEKMSSDIRSVVSSIKSTLPAVLKSPTNIGNIYLDKADNFTQAKNEEDATGVKITMIIETNFIE